MSQIRIPDNLTEDQADAIERAAYGIIQAYEQASQIAKDAGIEFEPDASPFVSRCGARLPPPRQDEFCHCPGYKGVDGSSCVNSYLDFGAADFGEGPSRRTCGHKASRHVIQI